MILGEFNFEELENMFKSSDSQQLLEDTISYLYQKIFQNSSKFKFNWKFYFFLDQFFIKRKNYPNLSYYLVVLLTEDLEDFKATNEKVCHSFHKHCLQKWFKEGIGVVQWVLQIIINNNKFIRIKKTLNKIFFELSFLFPFCIFQSGF